MQFSVPQFTEVEDKIIGPLTLRQFLILLVGAVIIFILFSVLGNLVVFLIISLPIAGFFLFAAFGTYNGKTLGDLMVTGASFFSDPTSYVFHKGSGSFAKVEKKTPKKEKEPSQDLSEEEKISRLHKLTYILNQDVKQEEQLLKDKYVHLK